jgi:hypothetical protein
LRKGSACLPKPVNWVMVHRSKDRGQFTYRQRRRSFSTAEADK